ncbi:hypothetical protein HOLleu_16721 [Holothuria leucospilota]|uniref:Uncharacterized protein n=1 Tax=Holothuria leucospilota TaxID=206669 RepID=A0A9Q1HB72_HOLLE|nr:hypothetical protein HOLleu_16721 [Holothuria leucospilota]
MCCCFTAHRSWSVLIIGYNVQFRLCWIYLKMEEKPERPGYLFRRNTTSNIKKQHRDEFATPKMRRQLSVIKEGLRPVMSDPSSLHTRDDFRLLDQTACEREPGTFKKNSSRHFS